MQIAKDSSLRLDAGIEHIFRELAGNGHTCYPHSEFLTLATSILLVTKSQVEERLEFLIKEKVIFKEKDFLWVYLFYFGETTIAREIQRLYESLSLLRSVDISKALEWAQKKLHITLAKEQAEAVAAGLKEDSSSSTDWKSC